MRSGGLGIIFKEEKNIEGTNSAPNDINKMQRPNSSNKLNIKKEEKNKKLTPEEILKKILKKKQ